MAMAKKEWRRSNADTCDDMTAVRRERVRQPPPCIRLRAARSLGEPASAIATESD